MRLNRTVLAAFIAAVGIGLALSGPAGAQAPKAQAPQESEEQFNQVKLTEAHIKGFIGAQKDIAALPQPQGAQPTESPDPKVQAQLEEIAKKHGFQSYIDYDDVAFNISMVLGGLDEQGTFTDPVTSIKKEIEDVKADKTIAEKDKKQMLDELTEALKHTPPLKYPENVEIVKKNRAEIEKVLQ
ncbi:MAG: hypothetical protein AB7L90_05715 [Hyphomicrobiaceae bacterium]